jgi:hypothetical protein
MFSEEQLSLVAVRIVFSNETQTGINYDTSFLDHYSGSTRFVEFRGRGAKQR